MFSRQAIRNRCLLRRIVTITFAFALFCTGLCVLPGYASGRDFPLADFNASYRITESLQGADLELRLVRSENGHVMTRKLAPSGLFSLFLPEVRIEPLNYVARSGRISGWRLFFD